MSFAQLWPSADPDAVGGNSEPPDAGEHDVFLSDARAFTSRKVEDWVVFTWTRLQDQYSWDVIFGFKSQAAANMAKRECREIGVDISQTSSLEVLDMQLKALIGGYYKVEVVQSGDFRSTYVRAKVGAAAAPAGSPVSDETGAGAAAARLAEAQQRMQAAATPAATPDDDVPF